MASDEFSERTNKLGPSEYALSEHEAYDSMVAFLHSYWERGGKSSNDLADLLSNLSRGTWADGAPADPAQWADWLTALKKIKFSK